MRIVLCVLALLLACGCSLNIRLVFPSEPDPRGLEEKLDSFEREVRFLAERP